MVHVFPFWRPISGISVGIGAWSPAESPFKSQLGTIRRLIIRNLYYARQDFDLHLQSKSASETSHFVIRL